MSPLTRRQLLALGAAGAGATAAGGAGLWWTASSSREYTAGGNLTESRVLSSRDRVLALDLEAAPTRVQVGGREASVQTFNGSLPGPTLRVAPGDTIRVAMTNRLQAPTNLHVHGLHVSPEGNSDNPFLSISSLYRPPESGSWWFPTCLWTPPATWPR
ncbi:multicopper oxidase domain-containing protein [Arthrobacter sp. H14]|uniref:multicopper oxidase domain-containing protein n=1 Tax=Arthrobacter sp. H14 TaxID=1312959 RepID=UPI0004BA631E|nr:multicopper oxidase domain-containing protein [Arthrobacter sp. H14]